MSEIAATENNPLLRRNYPADWTDLDTRAVDTIRVLAADAVEHCGSGHPGTAMSLAPVAYSSARSAFSSTKVHPATMGAGGS